MSKTFTVTLPDDIQRALEDFAQQEGVPSDQIIGQAVKQHIFMRRFGTLRQRLSAKGADGRDLTDEDIFNSVS